MFNGNELAESRALNVEICFLTQADCARYVVVQANALDCLCVTSHREARCCHAYAVFIAFDDNIFVARITPARFAQGLTQTVFAYALCFKRFLFQSNF